MGRIRGWSLAVIGLVVVLATAAPASAELFLDLYVGGSIFNEPDFTVTTANGASREVERGTSDDQVTGGGRFGYWFTEAGIPFLGVAGDVSYFEPTFTGPTGAELLKVSVRTVPMTPLVLLRMPLLQAPQYPTGQLNLYAGAGPGFFWTEREATFASVGKVRDDRVDVGVDFRAGIAWFFVPNVKVFAEYRFTHFTLGKESNRGTSLEADLDAHHVLFGVGFTFR